MITANGVLDFENQKVVAPDTGTWSALTTWDSWTAWPTATDDYMYWLLDPVDLYEVKQFCLSITTEANGIVDYYVYTSDTGVFGGEETETVILEGSSGIAAFNTRFYQIGVRVERLVDAQEISGIEVRVIEGKNKFAIDNLNTADINDGSTQGYVVPFNRRVGTITNVQITPQEVTPFQLDVYVTDAPTSSLVIPHVTNKTADSISFALYSLDNQPRDAVVDILIEYLPEMYMDGRNLRVR